MKNNKDDIPLKDRFLVVRKEIHNQYTERHKTEQQTDSVELKRSMSECDQESEDIEIDTDLTTLGARKQIHRSVKDRLIKKTSWSESVFVKGLTFDFFSDPLVRKDILVTVVC
jgi:hypothetical protein